MPQIQSRTVYSFDELSPEAQEKALAWVSENQAQYFEADYILESAFEAARILGMEVSTRPVKLMGGGTRMVPDFEWSGFGSYGDGVAFSGKYSYAKGASRAIRKELPEATGLHDLADRLQRMQKPFFYGLHAETSPSGRYHRMEVVISHKEGGGIHTNSYFGRELPEGDMAQIWYEFAVWVYWCLESEYEYQRGETACKEWIEANEPSFLADGSIA